MKIFECLMLGLLATSAMVPAINAMEDTKEGASVGRVFLYDAPDSRGEKALFLTFRDLFSNVCKEIGGRFEGFREYLQYKERVDILPTMGAGFQKALTDATATLNQALTNTLRVDRTRVLRLFEALAHREFRIYEGLFGRADELIRYLNQTTVKDESSTPGKYAVYHGETICFSGINANDQFQFLNLAYELKFESDRLKALHPSLIDTNGACWSLLAYLTNTNAVQCQSGEFKPVRQEALDIFHAYGNGLDPRAAEYKFLEAMLEDKNYTYNISLHFDLPEARRIAAIIAAENKYQPYKEPLFVTIGKAEILDAARVDGWNVPVVRYVPTEDVQPVQKIAVADMPPPPPRVVELFSPQAKLNFERVKTTLDTLHVAQEFAYKNTPDKKYRGYSRDEQIMAYGNDSVIPAALRADVSQLLTDQLRSRGMLAPSILTVEKAGTAKGYNAAASVMDDWIREKITNDGLAVSVQEVLKGTNYLKRQAVDFPNSPHEDLFKTLWALRSVSISYDALTEQQVARVVKDEMQSVLVQCFGLIVEHGEGNGACAAGAKGRNFLMQFDILKFFKDYHPTTLA